MVDEIMCSDLPVEEREQVMRDNCDQIIGWSINRVIPESSTRMRSTNGGLNTPMWESRWRSLKKSWLNSVPTTKERSSPSWSV